MNRQELAKRLVLFGYRQLVQQGDLAGAIRAFQDRYGLRGRSDAVTLDRATETLLTAPRCGCEDSLEIRDGNGYYRWDLKGKPLRYHIADGMPGRLSAADWRSIAADGFAAWSAVCGITFERVSDLRDAQVEIIPARIDGPSGVLADCELPTGIERQRRLRMRFDLGETFAKSVHERGIRALNTFTHEGGHLIGIGHEQTARIRALMDPSYDPNVSAPLDWDIDQAVARYGQPLTTPAPTPSPTPAPVPTPAPTPGPAEPVTLIRITGGKVEIDGMRIIPR